MPEPGEDDRPSFVVHDVVPEAAALIMEAKAENLSLHAIAHRLNNANLVIQGITP
jgi:hypothetical protein